MERVRYHGIKPSTRAALAAACQPEIQAGKIRFEGEYGTTLWMEASNLVEFMGEVCNRPEAAGHSRALNYLAQRLHRRQERLRSFNG